MSIPSTTLTIDSLRLSGPHYAKGISMSRELWDAARFDANRRGLSTSALMRILLAQHLTRPEPDGLRVPADLSRDDV